MGGAIATSQWWEGLNRAGLKDLHVAFKHQNRQRFVNEIIIAVMASRSKRAKLLPDLDELASRTRTTKKVFEEFNRDTEAMHSLSLEHDVSPKLQESLTEDQVFILLACKVGITSICRASSLLSRLPPSTPNQMRQRYLDTHSLGDSELSSMVKILSSRCASTMKSLSDSLTHQLLLAPPTQICLECGMDLAFYHFCKVKHYSFEGVTTMDKLPLRCTQCGLLYNYAQYGNKHSLGFRHYELPRENVEVNDCVYFDCKLLEFQCSLR